jgi:hypothetical protein
MSEGGVLDQWYSCRSRLDFWVKPEDVSQWWE